MYNCLLQMRRRTLLSSSGGGQQGEPMPPLSVLFVSKNDTTQKGIFEKDNWPSTFDWTPIGIVVVPGSHKRYGNTTNGIMSLGCLKHDGTMQTPTSSADTDSQLLEWGGRGQSLPRLTYNNANGTAESGYVQYQTNSDSTALSYYSTPNIAYPYKTTAATEHSIITYGSLNDYDGVGNTNYLKATASTFIAAAACNKFSTLGTSVGDWYLPAEGELAYLPSIRYQVNDTIKALNAKYGNVGVQLKIISKYWSSSAYSYNNAWQVYLKNGSVDSYDRNSINYTRAFLRF